MEEEDGRCGWSTARITRSKLCKSTSRSNSPCAIATNHSTPSPAFRASASSSTHCSRRGRAACGRRAARCASVAAGMQRRRNAHFVA